MQAPITLMERSTAGWRVELRLTIEGAPAIFMQKGEDAPLQGAVVPRDKALDAFEHPCCYLPR